jgi:phosphoglycolate phosphatase
MSDLIKGVLFDLDGTLLDTALDMTEALNALRAQEGLGALSNETVRCQVSHGGHALVRLGFGTLPPEEHEAMRMRLLSIYRRQLAKHTQLFEGGDEMLTEIERRGLSWGIVTNKPGWLTDPLLIEVNLHKRARAVVSGDTLAERKPHPLPLPHAAATMGVEPAHCVYVGDAGATCRPHRLRACTAGGGFVICDDDRADTWYSHGWPHTPPISFTGSTSRRAPRKQRIPMNRRLIGSIAALAAAVIGYLLARCALPHQRTQRQAGSGERAPSPKVNCTRAPPSAAQSDLKFAPRSRARPAWRWMQTAKPSSNWPAKCSGRSGRGHQHAQGA